MNPSTDRFSQPIERHWRHRPERSYHDGDRCHCCGRLLEDCDCRHEGVQARCPKCGQVVTACRCPRGDEEEQPLDDFLLGMMTAVNRVKREELR